MGTKSNNRTYYVISDLHIGGDEQLKEIDFLDELIDFLTELETTDEDAELIINGDAFGLWEFTELEGIEKFEMLEETYPSLFEQFKSTGKNIDITLLPGNHDHELAAYEEYVDRLEKYNINLVQERSVKRTLDGQVIHFEHGHQQDPNNKVEDWGNPHASPLGYYYNTLVTSRAGQLSDRGKFNWLKDVQAVTPTERVPVWLFSKYFYREMNPLLRYSLFPFLLLFNISVLLAVLSGLDIVGIWSMPIEEIEALFVSLGRPGTAIWTFLTVNIIIAGLILLVGIPLYFLRRDIRKTVNRFGVFETELTVDPERPYQDYAEELFTNEEHTTLFCYGHTHRPGVQSVDGGMIVNSGTWLKRLHRRDGIIGILPPVFYPSYQLSTVRISSAEQADAIAVDFIEVQKPSPATEELTWTERFFTVGREPDLHLPDRRVIDQEGDCKQIRTVRDSE
ncbi:metallophosphoesterase [Salinarchaeum sp. IM2453]|uniref:metallophosphoesterase n=1 Tax=Salinarchaeum sp. IM2453 TaxID=2862870 RepID=UPI001C8320DD|nr:metallophosphoesterase [Salinarchaeum sp. IM2453]QZA87985.1 metallophosphoesterase [Salinarchaeum sp. IM2453]